MNTQWPGEMLHGFEKKNIFNAQAFYQTCLKHLINLKVNRIQMTDVRYQ